MSGLIGIMGWSEDVRSLCTGRFRLSVISASGDLAGSVLVILIMSVAGFGAVLTVFSGAACVISCLSRYLDRSESGLNGLGGAGEGSLYSKRPDCGNWTIEYSSLLVSPGISKRNKFYKHHIRHLSKLIGI